MKEKFEKVKQWAKYHSGVVVFSSVYVGYQFGRITTICEVQQIIFKQLTETT